jgi:hypothetical protein
MEMQAGGAATPPAMPPVGTTPAATLATTPAATLTTSTSQPVWMSQSDWEKVVTRRELKSEQKVERPKPLTIAAQVGRAHRVAREREREVNDDNLVKVFLGTSGYVPRICACDNMNEQQRLQWKQDREIISLWRLSQRLSFHHISQPSYLSDDCAQVGPACGYVAARATNLTCMLQALISKRSMWVMRQASLGLTCDGHPAYGHNPGVFQHHPTATWACQ